MFTAHRSYSPPRFTNNPDTSGGAKKIRQDLVDAIKSREDGGTGNAADLWFARKECTLRMS